MAELSWRFEFVTLRLLAVAVGIGLIWLFFLLVRPGRARFSLRTLLVAMTVVCLLLAGWVTYRRASMARITWLPSTSAEFEGTFPGETVRRNSEGFYEFTYYPRRQVVQALAGGLSNWADRQHAIFTTAGDEATALQHLKALRAADVLPKGTFVIRGRVTDREGRPLADAQVDLLGPFVFINHFQTRDDGTFTMLLDEGGMRPPAGGGYYLRIRANEETADRPVRWNTATFSLSGEEPERVARIVVPR